MATLGRRMHRTNIRPNKGENLSAFIVLIPSLTAQFTMQLTCAGTEIDIYAQRVDQVGYLFAPPPSITLAGDVANDQGGQMRILWSASRSDTSPNTIVQPYTVWMGVKSTGILGKTSFVGKRSRLEALSHTCPH